MNNNNIKFRITSMRLNDKKGIIENYTSDDDDINDAFATIFELFADGYKYITIEKMEKKDD